MFEKCGNKKYSSFEPETYFSCNLSMHAPVCDDVLCAYAFGARIGLGLLHCSTCHVETLASLYISQTSWLPCSPRSDLVTIQCNNQLILPVHPLCDFPLSCPSQSFLSH